MSSANADQRGTIYDDLLGFVKSNYVILVYSVIIIREVR